MARTARRSRPLSALILAAAGAATWLWGFEAAFSAVPPFAGRGFADTRRQLRTARRQAVQSYGTGDKVQVLYDGIWYDCEVLNVEDSAITAKYDDGGDEEEDIDIASRVRPVPEPFKVEKGQRVEVEHEGIWYDCEVLEVADDGAYCTVKYDDGGDEEPDVEVESRVRSPRIKLDDLEVGTKYTGEVTGVREFGAFVNIGAEREGLVHISRMANERVENVEDYVMMGQQVDVWVSEVTEDGKLALSMVEGRIGGGGGRRPADLTPFVDIPSDEWITGVVARVAPFGAFVTVTTSDGSASADGLVHISAIRDGFVENVEDEVSEGQEVQVRILNVDTDTNRMSLTMKEGFGGGPRERADLTPFESIPSSEWITGKVARIAAFGAFVSVPTPDGSASADGLVHITRIRDGFVESVEDELEVGQEVQVRVTMVDVDGGKMSLSMKEEDADGDF